MTPQLQNQLAQALNIQPADIRDIREARDGGFNVVLINYQKFRNVEPQIEDPPEDIPLEKLPPPKDTDLVPGTEMYIPDDLKAAYANPKRANQPTLRRLCSLLGISVKQKERKAITVKRIGEWKRKHAP